MKTLRGFTLLELIVSITIIASLTAFVVFRFGVVDSYQEESFISGIENLPPYLLQLSMTEGVYYGIQFNIDSNSYKVGRIDGFGQARSSFSTSFGYLSQELNEFLAPLDLSSGQGLIDIPDSDMSEIKIAPEGSNLYEITTSAGTFTDGLVPVMFSPKGVAEFTVIHYRRNSGEVTLLLDPYSGMVTRYQGRQEFQWNLN